MCERGIDARRARVDRLVVRPVPNIKPLHRPLEKRPTTSSLFPRKLKRLMDWVWSKIGGGGGGEFAYFVEDVRTR